MMDELEFAEALGFADYEDLMSASERIVRGRRYRLVHYRSR